jgi:hypothetical protein
MISVSIFDRSISWIWRFNLPCRGCVAARWHLTVGHWIHREVDEAVHYFERRVGVGITERIKNGYAE